MLKYLMLLYDGIRITLPLAQVILLLLVAHHFRVHRVFLVHQEIQGVHDLRGYPKEEKERKHKR